MALLLQRTREGRGAGGGRRTGLPLERGVEPQIRPVDGWGAGRVGIETEMVPMLCHPGEAGDTVPSGWWP